MLVDLHVPAGSDLSLEQVFVQARRSGLDGICLAVRRDSPRTCWEELERLAAPLRLFRGVEVDTDLGPLLWLPPDPEQVGLLAPPGLDPHRPLVAEQAIGAAVRCGGVVVAIQPLRRGDLRERTLGLLRSLGANALEVWNAGSSDQENRLAHRAAHRLRFVGVGGSGGQEALGFVATLIGEVVGSQRTLVQALRRGDAWAVALRS